MPAPISIRDRTTLLAFPGRGRHVLVVGGGRTAASRVHALAHAAVPVTVVAPSLCDDLFDMLVEHRFHWVNRTLKQDDLHGAWLVHVTPAEGAAGRVVDAWLNARRRATATRW